MINKIYGPSEISTLVDLNGFVLNCKRKHHSGTIIAEDITFKYETPFNSWQENIFLRFDTIQELSSFVEFCKEVTEAFKGGK